MCGGEYSTLESHSPALGLDKVSSGLLPGLLPCDTEAPKEQLGLEGLAKIRQA